jgi:hypothetical protein
MTFSITILCHNAECHNQLFVTLHIVMLSTIMLNVVMLSVVAPSWTQSYKITFCVLCVNLNHNINRNIKDLC